MAAAGWFTDPTDAGSVRWWDGKQWGAAMTWDGTAWVAGAGAPPPPPAPSAAAPVQPTAAPTKQPATWSTAPQVQAAATTATPTPAGQPMASADSANPFGQIVMPIMSKVAWLLTGGALIAAVGVLLPWEQDTVGYGGTVTGKAPMDAPALALIMFAMLGLIVWVGLPARFGRLSKKRCAVLTTTVGLLSILPLAKMNAIANAQSNEMVHYGLGKGWYLHMFGLLAIWIATFCAWTGRGTPVVHREPTPAAPF